ncbi:MAG: vitamin K epoxide reductase family protein [Anaerolineales bacterium]|nr:vitamin K epoxide reductase family protein [Anaerolineales bacterium]
MSNSADQARPGRLRWVSAVLAALGVLDSAYLTWVKLANTRAFCSGVGDCDAVNSSVYSEVRGVPIALLGLGVYLLILGLLALERRLPILAEFGPLAVFGLALTGTLYSAYLTYVELFVLYAVCPYCVVSALLITGILVLAVARLLHGSRAASSAG